MMKLLYIALVAYVGYELYNSARASIEKKGLRDADSRRESGLIG